MKITTHLLAFAAAGTFLAGCDAPGPTTGNFSHLRLTSTSRAEAFDAARQAMSERFRLAEIDPDAGLIRSVPEETEAVGTAGQVGDVIGVRRRVRKLARTYVTGSETSADLWCKVTVERYESTERALFLGEQSLSDVPSATAVDRGGGTTPQQNAVWRVSHRDKATERSILLAAREILEGKKDNPPPSE